MSVAGVIFLLLSSLFVDLTVRYSRQDLPTIHTRDETCCEMIFLRTQLKQLCKTNTYHAVNQPESIALRKLARVEDFEPSSIIKS